ncbi:MAG: helix-turn-helix domain-containing protein [Bacteroidetes bacterium]|nr:helix-turn-helix domain-containing protein [Bacteroidota bacterium]
MKKSSSIPNQSQTVKKVRQLSAIMFADIVGYTAMMQTDEKKAGKIRSRHRQVFEEQHTLYRGKIVQYYGDGVLSVFESAIEAVQCAIEIQKLLNNDDPLPLRIGLHLGDIVYDETDIYGDGVNVASRIEGMGIAGAILISEKLNDELKNQPDISTRSLGLYELKNITDPVEVFAVASEGIIIPKPEDLKGKQTPVKKAIAVLPFVNMSASEENEYFSDGITEEIINALAKIRNIKVTSRTSSFYFKNKNIPIKEIAEELNVSVLLEGSVRLAGNMVRITAQLINADEDFHFWSETWDRKLENIFEIQDEVSLHIAEKLREHFGHFEIQEHLVEKQTDNIDAYEYSLKGKFHFNKWNPDDMRTAIGLYEKALELDPNHAESCLGLADALGFMATTGFMPMIETWQKVSELIQKAKSINENLAGVHYQLANLTFFRQADYKTAFEENMRSLELQANHAEAQQVMSFLYVISGRIEQARQHLDIAYSINPLSPETLFFNGYFHYMSGQFEEGLERLNGVLKQNPKNLPAYTIKCQVLLRMERYEEAIEFVNNAPEELLIESDKVGLLTIAYSKMNDHEQAKSYSDKLEKLAEGENGFRASSFLFLLYAWTNNKEKAFQWIENALNANDFFLLMLFADPLVDPIKDDPRYQKYRKLIFPETEEPDESKFKKALLDDETANQLAEQLMEHIRENKPYLEPALSIRSLAEQTDIHPNQLSWLLNEKIGKNFNDIINHYRVETFKKLAKDPKNKHLTLMALAYDSGFNSKTVFNTFFKKETGFTPKEFVKGS